MKKEDLFDGLRIVFKYPNVDEYRTGIISMNTQTKSIFPKKMKVVCM